MDQVLENYFRHVLETENMIQATAPPAVSAPLSGGSDDGKKWGKVAAAITFLAAVGMIGYGGYTYLGGDGKDEDSSA